MAPDRERNMTIRQRMEEVLRQGPCTAKDLSKALGIPEKDAAAHLEHLSLSLPHKGGELAVTPAYCQECGYAFRSKKRFKKPSRCPKCRGQHIEPQVFEIR